jgi:phosphoglycerol transferase MdoB-like AlkP superfamily enzyme
MALKSFVYKVKQKYPNTLFVLLADHCGGLNGSAFQSYLIPFALYHKDLTPTYYNYFISQRDIAPTILDLLYGKHNTINPNFTGKSLVSDTHFFADYYHNGLLGWVEGNTALEINITTKEKTCYDISSYKDIEIKCNNHMLKFTNKALSFTKISQKLLFSGKTNTFDAFKRADIEKTPN